MLDDVERSHTPLNTNFFDEGNGMNEQHKIDEAFGQEPGVAHPTYDQRTEELFALLPQMSRREYMRLALALAEHAGLTVGDQVEMVARLERAVSRHERLIARCEAARTGGAS